MQIGGSAGHPRAVGQGWRAAIGGVNYCCLSCIAAKGHIYTCVVCSSAVVHSGVGLQRNVLAQIKGIVGILAVAAAHKVVVAAQTQTKCAVQVALLHIAAYHDYGTHGAFHSRHIAATYLAFPGDGALVGDAGSFAGLNHLLQLVLVFHPVGPEQTGGARQGQNERIGCKHVVVHTVVSLTIGVMVVDEGHSIAVDGPVASQALLAQRTPVGVVERIVDAVLQTEVEGGTPDLVIPRCAVDPALDGILAVPVFTYGELGVHLGVVFCHIPGGVALHHVVAETHIAQHIFQIPEVGVHIGLYGTVGVVQVAATVEVITLVGIHTVGAGVLRASMIAVLGCEQLVVAADTPHVGWIVSPGERVSGTAYSHTFIGKVGPVLQTVLVVYHHILNNAYAVVTHGLNHALQIGLSAPAGVVLQPVHRHVAHVLEPQLPAEFHSSFLVCPELGTQIRSR